MKPIEALRDYVAQEYPNACVNLTPPLRDDGFWSLDIDLEEKKLAVEWSDQTGFGVSNVDPESYGERTDEFYDNLKEVKQRVNRLLTSNEHTSPPFGILLSRLRERRQITQQQLAALLHVKQATVSGMERRGDIQLSTLWRTAEALGGMLEIYCVFPEGRYRIDAGPSGSRPLTARQRHEQPAPSPALNYAAVFVGLNESGRLQRATNLANDISSRHAVIEMP